MPRLKGHRKTAKSKHRFAPNTFFLNADILTELEFRQLFHELNLIGDDDDNEIVKDTVLTEEGIDIVDKIVLAAEINAIELDFKQIRISRNINEALDGKGIGPEKRHIPRGKSGRSKRRKLAKLEKKLNFLHKKHSQSIRLDKTQNCLNLKIQNKSFPKLFDLVYHHVSIRSQKKHFFGKFCANFLLFPFFKAF